MRKSHLNPFRVLAIAPSTRGFGFALLEGQERLIDWGVKSITGDKNVGSIAKIEELITHYQPGVMVMEDTSAEDCRRSSRIKLLTKAIFDLAQNHKVKIVPFPRDQIRRNYFCNGQGTKHALAELLAARFPQELGSRLPPKRRPWMSEDYRMDIFDAVAVGLASRLK